MLGDLDARVVVPVDVSQEVSEHLEEVGFTGAKEARYPHAVGVGVVCVFLQQLLDALGRLVSEHVLLNLDIELRNIIGFDDSLNAALNVFSEYLIDLGHRHASCSKMSMAR